MTTIAPIQPDPAGQRPAPSCSGVVSSISSRPEVSSDAQLETSVRGESGHDEPKLTKAAAGSRRRRDVEVREEVLEDLQRLRRRCSAIASDREAAAHQEAEDADPQPHAGAAGSLAEGAAGRAPQAEQGRGSPGHGTRLSTPGRGARTARRRRHQDDDRGGPTGGATASRTGRRAARSATPSPTRSGRHRRRPAPRPGSRSAGSRGPSPGRPARRRRLAR